MVVLSVIYPKHTGTSFDHDYYAHKHLPMVRTLLRPAGLQELEVVRGTKTMDGPTFPYEVIAFLTFPEEAELRAALNEYGEQILGDIPNFTDMKPTLQLNDPVS